jgi:NTP pyrophosphatase (non-canonical NTP hydrolase)
LIALCHSELSEALEGHRKNLPDDKLPHRLMVEVELVDCLIRIFDLAGAHGYDLDGAYREKMRYNAQREDHKHENRLLPGGKRY